AGVDEAKDELQEIIEFLREPQKFQKLGGRIPKGVLLMGPPGTGKTLLARAVAGEANVPFFSISGSDFVEMFVGVGASRVRDLFEQGKKNAPCIVFIDEIDAVGRHRGAGLGGGHDEREQTLNQLLVEMDGFESNEGVILVAATNRPDVLDPALLRPGRFDRILHFGLPSRSARRELIDYFLSNRTHGAHLDSDKIRDDLASMTLGSSPASLERLFDEALLLALRAGRDELRLEDVRRARTEMEIGLPEATDYPEHERRTIATHEAGHATVAYVVGKGRRLEMLSIVKRRDALGFLAHRLHEERHTQKASELRALVDIALGGMVAEEIFFGESGTGPGGDLANATTVVVEMVGSLGLGGSLVSFRALQDGILGGNLVAKVLTDTEARRAVDALLKEAKSEVRRILAANRHVVVALRDALLERLELVDDEIVEVIESARPVPVDASIDLLPLGLGPEPR
ncbi:MAG TPA: AAA family ATPase, partial [Acidimicrobiia bacterium]